MASLAFESLDEFQFDEKTDTDNDGIGPDNVETIRHLFEQLVINGKTSKHHIAKLMTEFNKETKKNKEIQIACTTLILSCWLVEHYQQLTRKLLACIFAGITLISSLPEIKKRAMSQKRVEELIKQAIPQTLEKMKNDDFKWKTKMLGQMIAVVTIWKLCERMSPVLRTISVSHRMLNEDMFNLMDTTLFRTYCDTYLHKKIAVLKPSSETIEKIKSNRMISFLTSFNIIKRFPKLANMKQ